MAKYDFTPEQWREATRIACLFFTGKETPPETPQEREPKPQENPHPGPLFATPESIAT